MKFRFCIVMNDVRTQQGATQTLFKAISENVAEVPIIVVVTKTDEFRSIQRGEAKEIYEETTDNRDELDRKCEEYVVEHVQERIDLIEGEMLEVEGGHFDACVNVARSMFILDQRAFSPPQSSWELTEVRRQELAQASQ